ncbi:MAG: retropepsin-like aspartic protease [Blastocatellia bacterium]
MLERTITFRGSKGKADLQTLFDIGATYSCIRPDVVEKLAPTNLLPEPLPVETAAEGNYVHIESTSRLEFTLDGMRLSDEFMVVPGLSEQAIIGATTMQKWKIKLDFEHDEIITDPRAAKLKLM